MPDEPVKPDEPIPSFHDLLREIEESGLPQPEPYVRAHKRVVRRIGIYPVPNLAVDLCDRAFARAVEKALGEKKSPQLAKLEGKLAYCSAMPKLSGASNIRDFIACVTHAMMLDIFPGADGTRLLYAAQVAHLAHTQKRHKKPNKTAEKDAPIIEANLDK